MLFSLLTLFPEVFSGVFDHSIIKRARASKLISINFVNIRDFSTDKHHSVDDHPYGGGAGMVMRVDVIDKAIEKSKFKNQKSKIKERIILLDPRGKKYNQAAAKRLSKYDHLILICGHYEGVDNRVNKLVDESISVGDYVLTGGEIPAMVIVDSVSRLLPGVLKKLEATANESFQLPILEYPQYTKPQVYKRWAVPKILLAGNHKKIVQWRYEQAVKITKKLRPDLLY
ncbi:MAG: tRNA (guanosine(37)-N1)-methyltransferase TrmD [Patescibacteria group bacterium]|nr:tRNA (guanosine(37)-N1)-methyltransferase TrmD [Patescibacteria group bacterium]